MEVASFETITRYIDFESFLTAALRKWSSGMPDHDLLCSHVTGYKCRYATLPSGLFLCPIVYFTSFSLRVLLVCTNLLL
jgi:hypothetical protein